MSAPLLPLQQLWNEYFLPPEIESERPRFPYSWEALEAMKIEIEHIADEAGYDEPCALEIGKIVGRKLAQFNPQPDADMLTFAVHFLTDSDDDVITQKTAIAIATGTEAVYTDAELMRIGEEQPKCLDPSEQVVRDNSSKVVHEIVSLALPGRLPKAQVPKARACIVPLKLRQTELVTRIATEISNLKNVHTITGKDREHIFLMAQFAWESKVFKVLTKDQRSKINEARKILAASSLKRLSIIVQNFFLKIRDLFAETRGLSEEDHLLVTEWLEDLEDTIWPKELTDREYEKFDSCITERDEPLAFRDYIVAFFPAKLKTTPVTSILAKAKKDFDELIHNRGGEKASPELKALSGQIEAIINELVEKIEKERAALETTSPLSSSRSCLTGGERTF
jgi:hypothetical protein